ncbi:DEAD/DEAH box helicase [Neobacillus sp. NPDC093127]|uniref:DEAD/DEAH box helicase n=1 Tax=Neobacillus sp. NPDC093127 TaxID=3364296 RepID=UPI00380C38EA
MLQIFITNNIRIRGASTPLRSTITKALTYDNPAYVEAKRKRRRTWGIESKLELFVYDKGDIVTPRGFRKELEDILKKAGIEPSKVIVSREQEGHQVDFGPWNEDFIMRDYQQPMVKALLNESGVGIAPAGSGKTIMGMKFIHDYGRPTLWLTHTKDLMYQTAKKAEATLKGVGRIGFFGDGKHDWGDGKLIIATVQTLNANPHLVDAMNDFIGAIIIDEAHHFPAVQFVETAGKFRAAKMIGLTATPERKDGLQCYLYRGIGPQLHRVERDTLYDNRELIKPELKFVYTEFNYETASNRNALDSVDAGGDDLDYSDLIKHLIGDEKRAKLIAENILEAAPLGPAIVITESVRYCFVLEELVKRMFAARFPGAKPLRTAVVHGGISRYTWRVTDNTNLAPVNDDNYRWNKRLNRLQVRVEQYTEEEMKRWQVSSQQRKDILAACDRKEIDILFATQLAREGLDMPHLTVGHMAMPKRGDRKGDASGSAVEQEIGRIMRPDPKNQNKKAVWYDYIDYNVGVFKDQYYSRRKVYTRLGIKVPKKPRTERDEILDFLGSGTMFDLPL